MAALRAVAAGLLAVLLAAAPAAAVPAASFDGESGTLAGISASANATVTPDAARHGANGLAVAGTAAPAYARWNPDVVPQGRTHASATLWFRVLSRGPGESVDLFTIQSVRRTENFDLFVNGVTGQLQWDLYRANEGHTPEPLELGRWYLFEVQVEFAADEYSAQVRLDGVDQGTIRSSYPSTTVRAVIIGAEPAKTHSQQYDDLRVEVGDAPLGWLTTTPPTATITSPADGATFALGEAVTPAYACDGPDFAVVSCEGPATVDTSTVGPHSYTVTATDTAGQTASTTHHYTVVEPDVTDPVVELRRPADGATYGRGEVVEADFACEDAHLLACAGTRPSGAPIDTSTLGAHEFTVTATDDSGNETTVTHGYTVVDRTSPTVTMATPADGAAYARGALVEADFSCADEVGGSGLRSFGSCLAPVAIGRRSTPGRSASTRSPPPRSTPRATSARRPTPTRCWPTSPTPRSPGPAAAGPRPGTPAWGEGAAPPTWCGCGTTPARWTASACTAAGATAAGGSPTARAAGTSPPR